jgi:enoyl-CoA hydratase
LNMDVKRRLTTIIETLVGDPTVQVVILTGAQGVFVAGTDVAEMAGMTPTEHTLLATDQVFTVLRRCPKILIAAVEGYALGGGCELALACDLIVAGESARLGQPEIRVGIMPGAGGTQRLLRTVGKYRTMRLVLTGEPMDAREALAMGLLSDVVPDGLALARAMELARTIGGMAPLAVLAIKEVVQLGQDASLEAALALERKAFQLLFATQDQKEGMVAFLGKRAAAYAGS